jgi:hypothetical protein
VPGKEGVDQKGQQRADDAEQGDAEGDDEPGGDALILNAAQEQDERCPAGRGPAEGGERHGGIQRHQTVPESRLVRLQPHNFRRARRGAQEFGHMLVVIGDAGEAGIEDVQQRASTGEQEDRRQGDLHEMGRAVDGIAADQIDDRQRLPPAPQPRQPSASIMAPQARKVRRAPSRTASQASG